MLSRVVEWYNFLRQRSEPCEFQIIESQVNRIDLDLIEALEQSTWLNFRKHSFRFPFLSYTKIAP